MHRTIIFPLTLREDYNMRASMKIFGSKGVKLSAFLAQKMKQNDTGGSSST